MDDNRLLTKVATLYYKGMLNQQEIAGRLGLSRQTIGRYLKRAQEVGIVKIGINSNLEYSAELEFQLEKAFHLSEVIVVTPALETEESVKEALGEAGAAFLQRRVLPNDIIGVAWSSTVLQCALHLPRLDSRHVTVVQLNGSESRNSYSTSSERIVEQIARAFDGNDRQYGCADGGRPCQDQEKPAERLAHRGFVRAGEPLAAGIVRCGDCL